MKKKSLFITFEGTDGVGKSTQIKLLAAWLRKNGARVRLTHEPGGSPVAEKIRKILLHPRTKITDISEMLLYQVSRAEHVQNVIRPALKKGDIVLCDRFSDATLAYQGFGRGMDKNFIKAVQRAVTEGLEPDLTLLLDSPVKMSLQKAKIVKKGHDRLEREGLAFQARVRRGYLAIWKKEPGRVKRIPVKSAIEDTQTLIQKAVRKIIWP